MDLSICIPTYEAGSSLEQTLDSILMWSNKNVKKLVVAVDGKSVPEVMKKKYKNRVKFVEFPTREGQAQRINDLLKLVTTDWVVLTNDDVVFEPQTLSIFVKAVQTNANCLIAGNPQPLKATTVLESIEEQGRKIVHETVKTWNNGDNYLAVNGRLLALPKALKNTIKINKKIWNNDAYLYFQAKKLGYRCVYLENFKCLYRNPQTLSEYFRQARKFQFSKTENQVYNDDPVTNHYLVPVLIIAKQTFIRFVTNPVWTIGYLTLKFMAYIYSLVFKIDANRVGSFWETDLSTKNLLA